MSGDLLIVARNQPSLFEYLKEDFEADPDVRVLMDRRRGERRQAGEPWKADRRRADRRMRPPIDDKLGTVGFAVVRVE